MNVLLRDTEEFIEGKPTGALGLVLIRYVMRPGGDMSDIWFVLVLVWLTYFQQMQQHPLDGLSR